MPPPLDLAGRRFDRLTVREAVKAGRRYKWRCDCDRGGLVVQRTFVPVADVVEALGDLRSEGATPPTEEEHAKLVLQLAPDEHRRLKVKAAEGNTTMSELARNALRAAGLI